MPFDSALTGSPDQRLVVLFRKIWGYLDLQVDPGCQMAVRIVMHFLYQAYILDRNIALLAEIQNIDPGASS